MTTETTEPRPATSPVPRSTWLTALFVAVVLAVAVFQTPLVRFDRFAFWDSGAELVVQHLIRQGERPGVDFGYQYGLLPPLVGRLWYGVAGLSPGAFRAEMMACSLLTAWGLARFLAQRRAGPAGVALVALAVPDLLLVSYVTLVQALEQALLTNALAEQARGRRASALVLLTACWFVKPTLCGLQGLAVVLAVILAARREGQGVKAVLRTLVPALVTAAVLAALIVLSFGPRALAATFFPLRGAEIYRLTRNGFFFGAGRAFWNLPHAGLRDYFRYELGYWALATLWLAWGAASGLWRLAKGEDRDRALADEIVVTCAVVHFGYVFYGFGHRGTWVYTLPVLLLGVVALGERGRWHRAALWVFVALVAVNDRSKAQDVWQRWQTDAPAASTLGLWASPSERAEWERALAVTDGQSRAIFSMCDGASLLFPGFPPPAGAYFVAGNTVPAEVRRKAEQLAAARWVILAYPPGWPDFAFWPEIAAAALDGREVVADGPTLWVLRRRDDRQSLDPNGPRPSNGRPNRPDIVPDPR